jgi:hypothetical protein
MGDGNPNVNGKESGIVRQRQQSRRPDRLALALTFFGVIISAGAQDSSLLHMKVTGRTYTDDKISVEAPGDWTIAIDDPDGTYRGAILRKGKYVLRLCTACAQTSGIMGGRFNEIAGLVQPWYRLDPLAKGSPCGDEKDTRISQRLDRVDFWFRRDPAHTYDEEADDCRQPKTTATVWYGSYFAEHCSYARTGEDCGGYFLHHDWMSNQHAGKKFPIDEMAFAMTYEDDDLNQLPHQYDPELQQVLREATTIVRSVRYKKA